MKTMDINCDLGESFGAYTIGADELIFPYITSANIACGYHAGDPCVMDQTVKRAVEHGVGVGAHPGYPDLMGFGRRKMSLEPYDLRNYIIYQIGALQAFCTIHGTRLRHVKPHGALYNDAVNNPDVARAVAEAVAAVNPGLLLVTLAGTMGERSRRIAADCGLRTISEAFADRAYTPEGALVSRQEPGAVINNPDQAAERAVMMAAEGKIKAVDGSTIALEAQTLCVHGDTTNAPVMLKRLEQAFQAAGLKTGPMGA